MKITNEMPRKRPDYRTKLTEMLKGKTYEADDLRELRGLVQQARIMGVKVSTSTSKNDELLIWKE